MRASRGRTSRPRRAVGVIRRVAVAGLAWVTSCVVLAAAAADAPGTGSAPSRSAGGASSSDPPAADAPADRPNGFVLSSLRVPRADVVGGGPARDAIRSVDAPAFASLDAAGWVRGDTPVVGVAVDGEARAYPVHLLEWHQVVNDRVGGRALLVTYDPLTDLASAWRLPEALEGTTFGVSGLLDRDGFLIYDRDRESLFSTATGRAISGPRADTALEPVRVRVESMARFAARHPDVRVLAMPDRARIDYRRSPYSAYWISDDVPLAVRARDDRFHPKESVLGVARGGERRAYRASAVTRAGGRIVDEFAGRRLRVAYDPESGTFSYEAPEDVSVRSSYWFAWKSRYPETGVWTAPGAPGAGRARPPTPR